MRVEWLLRFDELHALPGFAGADSRTELATCYFNLGRKRDALEMERQIYQRHLVLSGIDRRTTFLGLVYSQEMTL